MGVRFEDRKEKEKEKGKRTLTENSDTVASNLNSFNMVAFSDLLRDGSTLFL